MDTLIHFTSSLTSLKSILERGLIYLYNPTVAFDEIFETLGLEIPECDERGMICFTEMTLEETATHRQTFGSYGIGVNKFWATINGARKVAYLEKGGTKFNALVDAVRRHCPPNLYGFPTADAKTPKFELMLQQWTLANPTVARIQQLDSRYVQALEEIAWMQTQHDSAEREWRMRSPQPFGGIGRWPKAERVEFLLRIPSEISGPYVVRIPPSSVNFFVCPKNDKGNLQH